MEEFASLWDGMETRWLDSIEDRERELFAQLSTEPERAAFRIVRSYARKGVQDGKADFPIACENLAARLGISREGAGQMRKKFVRLGISAQTAPYRANVAAARYRWILSDNTTNDPF